MLSPDSGALGAQGAENDSDHLTPLKNISVSQDEGKNAIGSLMILTNFILPGTLNQMARMTETVSPLVPAEVDDLASNRDFGE